MSKQLAVLGGAMGGGGGSAPAARTPVIAADSVRSSAIVEIVEAWGWGEMACFPAGADPLQYVYLDGTPIKTGSTLNFQGVTFDYRTGTQDQTYIPGIVDDSVGSLVSYDVPVTHGAPITRSITDLTTDAVRIILTFAGLMVQNATNGDRTAATVNLSIEVRADGGSWHSVDLLGRGTVSDKTEASYQRSFHVNLRAIASTATTYDIRVSRLSLDPVSGENSAFSWTAAVKLTYAKLRRPNVAYCRLTFDSRYFSAIPVRSYQLMGWLIQVPTVDVYDPVARTYTTADWTGGLVKRWCRNPAWFLYHLLTTAGAGLGADINPAYQDKWAIFTIAKRCDELVPNGAGGTEPRYSIDAQFMAQVSAHEMVQQLAGIFDAQSLWDGKAIYLTQDAPKSVTSLYLPANVINGHFAYSGTARQVRYTAALIQYNDPTDQYRLATEYVEDFDGITRYGYRPKTETAVGCISRAEAHRRGKRLLITSREEIDAVLFSTGFGGINDKPGNIIRIADPLRSVGQRLGGRISTGSAAGSINLDAPVTLATGTSYRLAIIGNDGLVWDSAITNSAGTYSTLTVSPAFASAPETELEWIVYDPLAIGQTFRVLSIVENEDHSNGFYTVAATQYAAGKFAEIDDLADFEAIPVNPYIVNGVVPPSGLSVSEGTYTGLEGLRRYLDLSWTASNDTLLRGYHLSYKLNGVQLFDREIVGQAYRIDNSQTGSYEITLAAINITGKYSSSITITHALGELYVISAVSITGLALPSGTGDFTGRNAFFTWGTNAATVLGSFATGNGGQSPWFRDYEVSIYDTSTIPVLLRTEYVTENTYSYSFEKNTEDGGPRRTFTVKVRARDYYGNYSNQSALTATNPAPTGFGAVSLVPGSGLVFVNYTQPTDPDYKYTRIYASTTSGFTPGTGNLVGQTTDRVTSFPAAAGTWYVKLQGVDEFGLSGTTYSTEISVVVSASGDITAAVDAALADPGRTGDVVVEASRFLVVTPGTTTPQKAVFGVGTIGGVATVGIKGDLVLDGTFYGQSVVAHSIAADRLNVSQLSAITADIGMVTAGQLQSADTLFNVDLANKQITIGNNVANTFGYTGTWRGTEYIDILSGAITTYQYKTSTNTYAPSKSLRVIDVGVATNNTSVTLPSYYSGQPKIMISPNNLQAYNAANSGQNQSLNMPTPVAVESSPGSGSWSFTPTAQLILSVGISATVTPADTKTSTSDTAVNSTQFTTAANTTQINCNLTLTSTKGTGTPPTWNARQVSARIRYGTVSGVYPSAGPTVVFKLGGNASSNAVTLSTGTITAGTYFFIVEYVSANSAVAPTTWSDGGAPYTYAADQTIALASPTAVFSVTQIGNGTQTISTSFTMPGYTSAGAGYSVYNVNWSGTYSYSLSNSGSGNCYIYKNAVAGINQLQVSFSGAPSVGSAALPAYSTGAYAVTQTGNLIADAAIVSGSGTASVQILTATAVVQQRKANTNPTTIANTFVLSSYYSNVSGTSALATGTVNYMAIY